MLLAAFAGQIVVLLSERVIEEARQAIRERFPVLVTNFERLLDSLPHELVPTPSDDEIAVHADLVPQDPDEVHVALST